MNKTTKYILIAVGVIGFIGIVYVIVKPKTTTTVTLTNPGSATSGTYGATTGAVVAANTASNPLFANLKLF